MKIKHRSLAIAIALATTASMTPVISQAAGTITFGEDKYVSVGFGLRSSFSTVLKMLQMMVAALMTFHLIAPVFILAAL